MAAFVSLLRTGDFLTRERVRLWATALLIGFGIALIAFALTAHGLNDYKGRPLGTDFSSFYAAGRIALTGHSPYDQAALHHMQETLFGAGTDFYSFAYPPIFLLIAAPLSKLPYLVSLVLWQGSTLALYLAAMDRLRKTYLPEAEDVALFFLLALGFTATFLNLTHGQNGFFTAALFALALSSGSVWISGLCLGLLAFKPQLGLLIPFALMADGRWRTFSAAAVTVLLLAAISTAAFGIEAWRGFLDASEFSRQAILDHGAVGYEKMVSVFAGMRLVGLPLAAAYAAQLVVAIAVVAATVWLWHSPADIRRKSAALCLGTSLVTPFALDYDMMILAPAIVLLAAEGFARGFRPWEKLALAALWFIPIVTRNFAEYTHIPLGMFVTLAGFGLVVRNGLHARVERQVFAAA